MKKKKISLLYKTEEPLCTVESLYDLSIDRCADAFCADDVRRDRFLSVLSHPLRCVENIVYRQDILRDLLALPDLTRELNTLFSRYDKIKSDWIEMRSGVRIGKGGNPEAVLEHTYTSLKTTASFPRTITSFFGAIFDAISGSEIKSEGLIAIREYCKGLVEDRSLEQITEIAERFIYGEYDDYTYKALLSLSDEMKITECELVDILPRESTRGREQLEKRYKRDLEDIELVAARESGAKKDGFIDRLLIGLASKSVSDSEKTAISAGSSDEVLSALAEALSRIDGVLTEITSDLYDIFHGLSTEMQFYDSAVKYCEFAEAASLPLIMPKMLPAEDDRTEISGLKDLFLAARGMNSTDIVANDFSIAPECDGMLIRGSNNTGKTVFLRSVGTAQILAQAGLPICAENAVMSVKSGIFSHFSAAEEDFTDSDTAGRFEGEVRCISGIIDHLTPYSLVLLNETFQTTAYDEGTDGMYGILSVLPRLKCKYVFVTHLLGLYDRIDSDKVLLMQTTLSQSENGYGDVSPEKRFVLSKVTK